MIIGSKNKFAFKIGKRSFGTVLRSIEIYIGNRLVTGSNNMVYLPSYIYALEREYNALVAREINSKDIFMSLGDTTDNFCLRAILNNGSFIIKQYINETQEIISVVPAGILLRILKRTAKILSKINA